MAELVPLFGTAAALREWFEDWAPAFELGVAVGTISLAFVTWRLARQAKQELERADRPCVYPITPHAWLEEERLGAGGRFLSFRNGGRGIAKNVRGEFWWHDTDGHAELVNQTLGPGDHFRVWLRDEKRVTRWYGAEGYVVYEDVSDVQWQSRFRYEHDGKQVWARLDKWGRTSELGPPKSAFPRDGWAEEELPDGPEPGTSVYDRRGVIDMDID
jgi:hypothetical protein